MNNECEKKSRTHLFEGALPPAHEYCKLSQTFFHINNSGQTSAR